MRIDGIPEVYPVLHLGIHAPEFVLGRGYKILGPMGPPAEVFHKPFKGIVVPLPLWRVLEEWSIQRGIQVEGWACLTTLVEPRYFSLHGGVGNPDLDWRMHVYPFRGERD